MNLTTKLKRHATFYSNACICLFVAPELAGWGEQLGGGVEKRTVVTPHVRAINGFASVLDISHGQRIQVGAWIA